MLGDVEEDTLGTVEFDLEAADAFALLVHVMLAAQRLDSFCRGLDVLDEDAEMVQPAVVEPLADLVRLESQDRQIDRAVAQVITIGERAVGLADFLEIERLFVELRHPVGVFRGNRNVAQLGHAGYSAASLTGAGSGSAPAQACSAMSKRTRSGP